MMMKGDKGQLIILSLRKCTHCDHTDIKAFQASFCCAYNSLSSPARMTENAYCKWMLSHEVIIVVYCQCLFTTEFSGDGATRRSLKYVINVTPMIYHISIISSPFSSPTLFQYQSVASRLPVTFSRWLLLNRNQFTWTHDPRKFPWERTLRTAMLKQG